MSRLYLLVPLVLTLPACGDDSHGRATADDCPVREPASLDLADRLAAAPCVASATELASDNPAYRAFDLRFTQLVDHTDRAAGTFEQQATLIVRDEHRPTILVSTGYSNYYGQGLSELTALLDANQIVVEHRYFNISIPESPDWTQLTIGNAADDHHQIVEALRPILDATWLSTGASKGGMTSVYHRRFWPDDVDGTVPYVAPLSFGAPDDRYDAFTDAVGTPACRQALQDLQVELLTNRRDMLLQRATDEATLNQLQYTRIPIEVAVESSVQGIYWAWWQYTGITYCDQVPTVAATDDEMWSFLQYISSVSGNTDDNIAFFEPYYYQAEAQLGYPGTDDTWLDGLILHGDFDWDVIYPVGVPAPTFDPEPMHDIDDWVQSEGSRLLFVYGEWDPWTGGEFRLGDATESALYVVPEGTHGSQLTALPDAERDAAMAMLAEWSGVTPVIGPAKSAPRMRVPPALLQAWRQRARAR
jgi:hypothetical protein